MAHDHYTGVPKSREVIITRRNILRPKGVVYHNIPLNNSVSVEDFGALGDGTNNDTKAIRDAISSLSSVGGIVRFGPGTFRIEETISLSDWIYIVGSGPKTIVKPLDNSGDSASPVFLLSGISYAGISHLKIDGNATNLTQASGHSAILISGSNSCVVSHVIISDVGKTNADPSGAHIVINAYDAGDPDANSIYTTGRDSSDNIIEHCFLDDSDHVCSFGIQLVTNWLYDIPQNSFQQYTSRNLIQHNHLVGFTFNALSLEGPTTNYNKINNNSVKDHNGNTAFDCDKGSSYNVWTNNTAYDFLAPHPADGADNAAGFRCQGYTATDNDRIARGNIFKNNVVKNLAAANNGSGCMVISNLSHDTIVEGNSFNAEQNNNQGYGIEIRDKVSNVIIKNNKISNSEEGITNSPLNIGTTISGYTISGNIIDSSAHCVRLKNDDPGGYGFTGVVITGNQLNGNASSAIQVGNNVSDVNICHNIVDTTGTNGIQIDGFDMIVDGNIVKGQSNRGIWLTSTVSGTVRVTNNVAKDQPTPYQNSARNFSAHLYGNTFNNNRGPKIMRANAAPTTGTFIRGDIVYDRTPSAGGNIGWVCTAGGSPGTWKTFGTIAM